MIGGRLFRKTASLNLAPLPSKSNRRGEHAIWENIKIEIGGIYEALILEYDKVEKGERNILKEESGGSMDWRGGERVKLNGHL